MFLLLVTFFATLITDASDLWEEDPAEKGTQGTPSRLEDKARRGREVWERLDLGRQRAILEALVVVTVLPQRPGRMPDGSRFDTDAVRIEPAASPARH